MKNVYGMEHVEIEKNMNGTYVVIADTKRFGKNEVMFESYDVNDCLNYVEQNGVNFNYDVRVRVNDAIKKIVHHSCATDSYDITYTNGSKAFKVGSHRLTAAEERFIWEAKIKERWEDGGLTRIAEKV